MQKQAKEYISNWRRERHLTQAQLAALLGVPNQQVSNWERGAAAVPPHRWPHLMQVLSLQPKEANHYPEALAKERANKLRGRYLKKSEAGGPNET